MKISKFYKTIKTNVIVWSIESLSFIKEELDLIWSEGVIDSIGFEKALKYWTSFLKKNGYIVVICPSWLTDERPIEIENFWNDAVQGIDTISDNISIMKKIGYTTTATFVLLEQCWTENYFAPRETAGKVLLKKYAINKIVESYIEDEKYEVELYKKYKQYYGYVFYIGKKI